jgi:dihydrolipoamide dehydrogenase
LATGSHPKSLPHLKIDEKTIISSDTALEITSLPKSLLIIGAGPIGVEFASIFSSLGTKTILVEIMPQILPQEDEDAANELQRCLKKQGITIFTSSEVISCQNGIAKVKQKDGTVREVEYEKILMAVGRGPNINNIGIEKVGIELKDGFIKVNEWMQTNIKTIYAIGDILKSPQLAHVGSAEGILCAEKIAGKETTPPNYDTMPSCTYSFPQVARVGLTEKQAREVCRNLKSAKYPFSASPMASVTGNTEGFVKIISDSKTGEVLGVHIVHELATELISQGGLVLSGRLKVNDIINTVIPHPTLSEAILETARQIYNIAINF